jgi:hypothetical protein
LVLERRQAPLAVGGGHLICFFGKYVGGGLS